MYDPMVAKLIVWDVDREQATARMLRALREYEIEELKTLLPFHEAILADRAVGRTRETCRDLIEDRKWLKELGLRQAGEPADRGRATRTPKVEQTYTVEVSGKRFDVKVIGPPFGGERRANGAGPSAGAAAAARKPSRGAASARLAAAAVAAATRSPRRCRAPC